MTYAGYLQAIVNVLHFYSNDELSGFIIIVFETLLTRVLEYMYSWMQSKTNVYKMGQAMQWGVSIYTQNLTGLKIKTSQT